MGGMALRLLVPPLLAVYVLVVLLVLDTDKPYAHYALVLPVSYVLGSIPWGFLMIQGAKGVDIREYGSGKTGTSNVLRTAGISLATLALVLDTSKGVLAVFMARAVADTATAEVAAGLLALVGHIWPLFLGFKGGRGIATGMGGLLVMSPIAVALGAPFFISTTLLSRYLSLGSIVGVTGSFFGLLALVLLEQSSPTYLWYAGAGGLLIIGRHWDNIQRLRQGKERKLGQSAGKLGEASSTSMGRG